MTLYHFSLIKYLYTVNITQWLFLVRREAESLRIVQGVNYSAFVTNTFKDHEVEAFTSALSLFFLEYVATAVIRTETLCAHAIIENVKPYVCETTEPK